MLALLIERSESMCVNKKDNWMDSIKEYLKNEAFPEDKRQFEKIIKRFSLYYMENE